MNDRGPSVLAMVALLIGYDSVARLVHPVPIAYGQAVAIAVVDPSGNMVAFAKMDNTQIGSIEVSLEKAKSAALFKRSTKVFEDALATGGANLRILKVPGAAGPRRIGALTLQHLGRLSFEVRFAHTSG